MPIFYYFLSLWVHIFSKSLWSLRRRRSVVKRTQFIRMDGLYNFLPSFIDILLSFFTVGLGIWFALEVISSSFVWWCGCGLMLRIFLCLWIFHPVRWLTCESDVRFPFQVVNLWRRTLLLLPHDLRKFPSEALNILSIASGGFVFADSWMESKLS